MARKLNRHVTVSDPETGQSATFGPEDEVPEWAEERITAEGVWEGDEAQTSATDKPVADASDGGGEGDDSGASSRRRGR